MAVPVAPTLAVAPEPERAGVRITLGIPAGATSASIWRVGPSGVAAYVRSWQGRTGISAGSTVIVRDYEAPLDVPLSYYASAANAEGTGPTSPAAGITVSSGGQDWLCDLARPANSRPVLVEALPSLRHDVPESVHRVLGRRDPVVASEIAWTWSGELRFLTTTDVERQSAQDALGNGIPVLLKTPPTRGVGNVYLSVTGWEEQRVSRISTYTERRFVVACAQVQRPHAALYQPTPPADYAEVKAAFATYAALKAARASYDALLYDYGAADPESPVSWPPTDV